MSKRNIEAVYPLSPMQQGMLFHSLYAPDAGMYIEQFSCVIKGCLDVPAFKQAWQQVVDRHSVLRTSFVLKRLDQMLQVVAKNIELPFQVLDWRNFLPDEQAARLEAFLSSEQRRGFDLSKAPLIRLTLIQVSDDVYRFVWFHHHALLDGWSMPLLLKEVLAYYDAYSTGTDLYLPPSRPFRDYISWLQSRDLSKAQAFWESYLRGFLAPTPFGIDRPVQGPLDPAERFVEEEIWLPSGVTAALQTLSRQYHLTLSTLVQAAWAILLSRYSGEEDIVFGTTISGRPAELERVESMIGLFINTLPVRVQVTSQASIVDWLVSFQARLVELRQYEYSSLVQIQDWSDVSHGKPLFESILVFENYPVDDSLREQKTNLKIEQFCSHEQTNYPLTIVSAPGAELPLKVSYDRQRFKREAILRMLEHLGKLLEGMAANPEQKLEFLTLLTDPEKEQLLVSWNQTQCELPQDMTAHQWFESQVETTPEGTAVIFEDRQISYADLNRRANQLAHYLTGLGVGPGGLVGISMEKSIDMVVAILGVMKAGCAYLPLDPANPLDRLEFMLEDAAVPVILTQSEIATGLPAGQSRLICLDTDWERIEKESQVNPKVPLDPASLAYVIYTSGSTGRPKGTLLHHTGLCNLVSALLNLYLINPDSRVLQFSSSSFDGSVADIFTTLLSGATLVLASREILLSLPDLLKLLRNQRVSHVTMPPSMLAVLPSEDLPALETVVSVGEVCRREIVERWSSGRRFFNGYGPTESTVATTLYQVGELEALDRVVPIGRPISNTKVYVLDSHMRLVPVGVTGELHIGGVNLSHGYLNRPEMTAARFIPNPFNDQPGARLYKTGDLVRYREDGNLEFIGRTDHQIKLRGFRVELGEIEAAVTADGSIQAAAVIVDSASQQLVAYIVPENLDSPGGNGSELNSFDLKKLRDRLKGTLPEYMVPAAYVVLDVMPLNQSGKIDRVALLNLNNRPVKLDSGYVPPRDPIEDLLVELWASVLRVEKVGVFNNFFDLGGHSLKATQLVSRIRETFKVEMPLRELFEHPTVAELAERIEMAIQSASGLEAPPIQPTAREGELTLSYSQQRLWFLDQLEPGNLFYNIPMAFRIQGLLEPELLERCLNEIVSRHEVLRTIFKSVDGKPTQEILPALHLPLPVEDLRSLPEWEQQVQVRRRIEEETRQPFDLSCGPLMRARLLRMQEEDYIILLSMHHIVSDGWSMGIFIKEISHLYTSFAAGLPPSLPPLPVQYADYARWQRDWLQGETLEKQLGYWKHQLGGYPLILELPTDRPRPAVQSWRGATEVFSLPQALWKKLVELSREEGATLFFTLLAAFQTLLYRYTGQESVNVGTAIANRNRAETEALIGFFVNTLVFRGDLSGEPSFREFLKRVREVALEAYAHQDLPFEMLVEALQPERDMSHTPLFQVAFAFQNVPVEEMDLPGISLSPFQLESGTAKFDLTLFVGEAPDGLQGALEYNTDLFDQQTIERLIGHYQAILEEVVTDPDQQISKLNILTESERQEILVEWNQTEMNTPMDRCAHELFEERAARQPDRVALIFEDQVLSYAELNCRSNQLARYLQNVGVQPGELVGISTERSPEMIVGILGTLKAGGAYLPLDPTYPSDRLAFMLQDSQVQVLLTQAYLADRLPQHTARDVYLDTDWEVISKEETANLKSAVTPEDLAYIIYTSGSTGKPKGALLRHRGLSNLTGVQKEAFGIREGSRVLQFSPFSFDASVWETFMALANGATLCLARQEVLAYGPDLIDFLRNQRVTNVTLPPSMLRVMSSEDRPGGLELPDLKTVIAAGEACTPDLVSRWAPGRDFFNAYGPTETTVCASMYRCQANEPGAPPIGRPVGNTQLYILDSHMQPVPTGVPGELYVAGVNLAREYLNRPEMTAAKFVPNPFRPEPGSRLYRTGDLVRYRPDGNIEFLGRIDHQVKLRGYRIELGEIESVLASHAQVREAVVTVREDIPGDRRLVGYVVAQQGSAPSVNDLRSYLRKTLPEYMVPPVFVYMDALPVSPSGKVDRKVLPAPDGQRPELEREYIPPRTAVEEELAEICAGLLGIERVGIQDNFFELGGHSLLGTQFISRVRNVFKVELPLRSLFETPTIAALAEKIEQSQKTEQVKIVRLLEQLDHMAPEEVLKLLEQKRALKIPGAGK